MARTIERPFGGELRRFALRLGELRDLQDKCAAGPATILVRLSTHQPQAADARRPRPDGYASGKIDPDYLTDAALFDFVRSVGGDWRVDDIRETIRLGLIGGGMTPSEAYAQVARNIDDQPGGLLDHIGLAIDVLHHALVGEEADPVGKQPAETSQTATTG